MRAPTVAVLQQVHHVELGAGRELGEVDDDGVALANALSGEGALAGGQSPDRLVAVEIDRVLHEVAVVRNHVEGNPVVRGPGTRRARQFPSCALDLLDKRKPEVS